MVATRILIAELDSLAQATRFADRGARAATVELTGMLRLGMLVSGDILITDAMLLDGAYFLSLGPEGLLRELGAAYAHYPLTITGTYATLREGLRARRNDSSFLWSVPEIRSASGVPANIEAAWEDWLRAVEAGLITYEKQSGSGSPLRLGGIPIEHRDDAELGAAIAAAELSETRSRSVAFARIDGLGLSEEDSAPVRAWWNTAYLRMIAENVRADWVSFETDVRRPIVVREQDVELPISADFVDWARRSTPATISLAWDASRSQRLRLRERPTWGRMRDLAFVATQAGSVRTRRAVLTGSTAKVLIAIVVIVLALPQWDIGALDNPWTWVAFAGALLATVPFDSLLALRSLLTREPRARFVLYGRSSDG